MAREKYEKGFIGSDAEELEYELINTLKETLILTSYVNKIIVECSIPEYGKGITESLDSNQSEKWFVNSCIYYSRNDWINEKKDAIITTNRGTKLTIDNFKSF